MFDVHRDVLSKFIHHQSLKDITTYYGYRGDYLLKMTTHDGIFIELISNYCEMKSIDYVVKQNIVDGYEVYIIAIDDDVIPIKKRIRNSDQSSDKWFDN